MYYISFCAVCFTFSNGRIDYGVNVSHRCWHQNHVMIGDDVDEAKDLREERK